MRKFETLLIHFLKKFRLEVLNLECRSFKFSLFKDAKTSLVYFLEKIKIW